ncbi:fluoroquinolone transport system permease protein [Alkalithermobacter thermoalcaliphilus JW-YL-7 = DSM 7308]|uniref:ABC transporter permease n=2 Tax=Clostridium paradoxum TaxID=29346 RepID=A0A150FP59_CLOPD|nr:ABC transporter permease [[Clostridium] paradoxum JW-YL-7 = DSM 7308]SHK54389.1 fluoroquinolone transport system permease protein [[Clostridium] paradoxum JW-YL-7 = DSM 7308]
MTFMLFYPIVFGLIGRYFLPWTLENRGLNINIYADLIIVILTLFIPEIYGALVGFSILDDRDDNILMSVKVTPLNIHRFLAFRLVIVFILSFLGCIYVMKFSDIGNLIFKDIVYISFLASLSAPMIGLLINLFSKNKIEGFAVMKGLGTLIVFPIISLFFIDKRELFFSFVPAFYPAKAISSIIRGDGSLYLTYNQYYFIGLVYVILLNIIVYKLFIQKLKV